MKKFLICLLTFLLAVNVFADENILYKFDVDSNFNGYSFKDNFEISSQSGYFNKKNLDLRVSDKYGLLAIATDVPDGISTSFDVTVPYPTFLNEPNIGAGFIDNVATIKQIKIVGSTNRPYDEIILLYTTTPNGPVHSIKMPQDFSSINSSEEFTLVFDNPAYESDVKKRTIKSYPIISDRAPGIYLVGFRIKTNAAMGNNVYGPYAMVGIKEVSIIYDKAFTDEQLNKSVDLKEKLGIDEISTLKNKTISEIEEKVRLENNEMAKMDKGSTETKTETVSEK